MKKMMCLAGVMLLSLGVLSCSESGSRLTPTAPTPPSGPQPSPPPPNRNAPPLEGPATRYRFSGQLDYPVRDSTKHSEFVLYANGGFALRYLSNGFQYVGAYVNESGDVSFFFEDDDRWDATGVLGGDLLEVRYNDTMVWSDFEPAVYRRLP